MVCERRNRWEGLWRRTGCKDSAQGVEWMHKEYLGGRVISDGGERVGVRACEARDRNRGTAGRKRREEAVEIRAVFGLDAHLGTKARSHRRQTGCSNLKQRKPRTGSVSLLS
jgi:hypothetical protein